MGYLERIQDRMGKGKRPSRPILNISCIFYTIGCSDLKVYFPSRSFSLRKSLNNIESISNIGKDSKLKFFFSS